MEKLAAFGRFWYDFVVGDDWRLAIGVVVALSVAGGLVDAGIPAWWVVPVAIAAVLGVSLIRVTSKHA
jgi:hypothetical protein